jgi:hypothetical protein
MTTRTAGKPAARTARTTWPSIPTRVAPASTPSPTTPSAPASNPDAEPQHPPCDIPHHLKGRGCGWTNCGFCGEEFHLGQKLSYPAGFHHWPDGETAHWAHAQTSEKHQLMLEIHGIQMAQLLIALPTAVAEGRAHQKLMRDPALAPLRRLFR